MSKPLLKKNNYQILGTSSLISATDIQVTVYVPNNIPECLRQEKINFLYDILSSQKKKAFVNKIL